MNDPIKTQYELIIDKINLVVNYIKYNIIGLTLFVLVFVIIYFIDYINYTNSLMYATQSIIPGIPSTSPTTNNIPSMSVVNLIKKRSKKRSKKR